jgi:hypothetical protein
MKDGHNAHERVRLTDCHDWSWTDSLWQKNATDINRTVMVNLAIYFCLAYWATYYDGWRGIDNMYLITATLTTVRVYVTCNPPIPFCALQLHTFMTPFQIKSF